jgi:hypothetical protein
VIRLVVRVVWQVVRRSIIFAGARMRLAGGGNFDPILRKPAGEPVLNGRPAVFEVQ